MKKIRILILNLLILISLNCNVLDVKAKAEPPKKPPIDYGDIPSITFDDYGKTNVKLNDNHSIPSKSTVLNRLLTKYRVIIVFLLAFGMLSSIMFFIFNFIELGNSRGNPQARQKAVNGLIMSGVSTAGLGSVILITTLFYNIFI